MVLLYAAFTTHALKITENMSFPRKNCTWTPSDVMVPTGKLGKHFATQIQQMGKLKTLTALKERLMYERLLYTPVDNWTDDKTKQ